MVNMDLWDNLVNVVFVHPVFFFLILMAMMSYYTIIYDMSWWVFGLFASIFITWLAYVLVGEWLLVIIGVAIAFFLAVQVFRKFRT